MKLSDSNYFMGRFWVIDDMGYIKNDSSYLFLNEQDKYSINVLNQMLSQYFGNNLQSIYISGSISRGLKIPGKSDIDYIVVLKEYIFNEAWIKILDNSAKKFGYMRFDCKIFTESEIQYLGKFNLGSFLIKTQGLLMKGKDFSKLLINHRPDIALANHEIIRLGIRMKKCIDDFEMNSSYSNLLFWTPIMMKAIIRTTYFLTYPIEKSYTRDLPLCCEVVKKYFPDISKIIETGREYYFSNNNYRRNEIIAYLKKSKEALGLKIEKWLSLYNPNKEMEI